MIHFISGLPRSGSTLLSAILRQNPRFHSGISSPLINVVRAVLEAVSAKDDQGLFVSEAQKTAILHGVFGGYYPGCDTHFDTNRGWTSHLPLLATLLPRSKIICCVRDVPWIANSVEMLLRKNPLDLSGLFNFDAHKTVYGRAESMGGPHGFIGYSLNSLKEAFYSEEANGRMILVDYDALTENPGEVVAALYEFLDEKPFYFHDFESVEFASPEFDRARGMPGLHTVRREVKPQTYSKPILPPDLFGRFMDDSFWYKTELNTNRIPIILPKAYL